MAARRWHAKTIKDAIAAGDAARLGEVPPDETVDAAAMLAADCSQRKLSKLLLFLRKHL